MKKLLFVSIFLGLSAFAETKILCETPYRSKALIITDHQVAVVEMDEFSGQFRSFASVKIAEDKDLSKGSLKRSLNFEGHNFVIRIKDLGQLSSDHDLVTITNARNHRITYPISCQHLN